MRFGWPAARLKLSTAFVFLALTTVYVGTYANTIHLQGDGYYTYLWARSLAYDLDLDLRNDYELCGDPWRLASVTPPVPGPWPHNSFGPGSALVWAPMLRLARVVLPEAQHPAPLIRNACAGRLVEFALFGSVLMGLFALGSTYRLASRYVDHGPALFGVAAIGLASVLPYYATMMASYSHTGSAFATALFIERWDATRGRNTWLRWCGLGVLLGIAMLMRTQNALLVLAPMWEWLAATWPEARRWNYRTLGRNALFGVLFVLAAILVFSPQFMIWKNTYGSYVAVPQGPHFMRWGDPDIAGVFFSTSGGLLFFNPLLYGSVAGLFIAALHRRLKPIAFPILLTFVVYAYVNAAAWDWWGSAGFSNRRFVATTVLLGFGLAVFAQTVSDWVRRAPRVFLGTVATSVVLLAFIWNHAAMRAFATNELQNTAQPADVIFRAIFHRLSTDVQKYVGNPLSWPASVPFALAYGTHPRHYDVLKGQGIFYQEFRTRQVRVRDNADSAMLGSQNQFEYCIDGCEPEPRDIAGSKAAVTTGAKARILLPLFADNVAAIEIQWQVIGSSPARRAIGPPLPSEEKAPKTSKGRPAKREAGPAGPTVHATLEWQGRPLGQFAVPLEWNRTVLPMPTGVARTGINELTLTTGGAPIAIRRIRILGDLTSRGSAG